MDDMRSPTSRIRGILLLLSLTLLLPVTAGAQQYFPPDEDLHSMLRYLVEDGETPGIVLGVLEADGSTRILTHGTGGPDTRPLGPRSVFEIGSINKTFTGTLLADMARRGEVALEDPVQKYLPDGVTVPAWDGRGITLLDLATHRSGLPRLPDNHTPSDPQNPYADYTVEAMYEFLSGHELRREPGAEGEYSNLGFGLLGHALARAAGTSYVDLVRERILEPLGMTMTGYEIEGELAEWMTKGHGEAEVVPYWFATESIQGAGGLRSSVEDMLKYLDANVGAPENDLERAMRDAHAYRADVEGQSSIGLGWQRLSWEGRTILTHGGGTGGYSTRIAFDEETGIGVVRLTNTNDFEDDIAMDFMRRGAPLGIPEIGVPTEVLGRYAGKYELAPGQHAVFRMEDDGYLTMQAPGNVRFRMYPESETKFFLKRTPWRFQFTMDEAGEVVGVQVNLGGNDRRARRVGDPDTPPAVVAGNAVPQVEVMPLPAASIPIYEGTYTLQVGPRSLDVRVFGQAGTLMVQPSGQGVSELLRVGDHEFVLGAERSIRLVFTVADGRAESMALHQGGGVYRGERKP